MGKRGGRGGRGRRGGGRGGRGKRGMGGISNQFKGGSTSIEGVLSSRVDPASLFYSPKPFQLRQVPLEFNSLPEYAAIMANNILAEFWCMLSTSRGTNFSAALGNNSLHVPKLDMPEESMMQHLVAISCGGVRNLRIISNQTEGGAVSTLQFRPPLSGGGGVRVTSYGYIGSYLTEFQCAQELHSQAQNPQQYTNLVRSILCPKRDMPGDYVKPKGYNTNIVPMNKAQREAVSNINFALEKIQGPPGTGKSTTLYHIITQRVPPGRSVLVTCSRNVAVESIAQKLSGGGVTGLLVFGNSKRIGDTAQQHLLDKVVVKHPNVSRYCNMCESLCKAIEQMKEHIQNKQDMITAHVDSQLIRLPAGHGTRRRRIALLTCKKMLIAYLMYKYTLVYQLLHWSERVSISSSTMLEQQITQTRSTVLSKATVFLCTIASTSRLMREYEEEMKKKLQVHTVIVDESGCTPESSTPMLLRLNPVNMILIGDHKQLPPMSHIAPQQLENTGHDRSLLERTVMASGKFFKLIEQYRMHGVICAVVSSLFYNNRLQTPPEVHQERQTSLLPPLLWYNSGNYSEQTNQSSYCNPQEAEIVSEVCTSLRSNNSEVSICVLTFYKGQAETIMKTLASNLNINVLTVDASQGCEYDYVVLSCVRSNNQQRIGFLKDVKRINVGISRAKYSLVIVGNKPTLSVDPDWYRISNACTSCQSKDFKVNKSGLQHAGNNVSLYDALKQQAAAAALARQVDANNNTGGQSTDPSTGFSIDSLVQMQVQPRDTMKRGKGKYNQHSNDVEVHGAVTFGGTQSRKHLSQVNTYLQKQKQGPQQYEQSAWIGEYSLDFPEVQSQKSTNNASNQQNSKNRKKKQQGNKGQQQPQQQQQYQLQQQRQPQQHRVAEEEWEQWPEDELHQVVPVEANEYKTERLTEAALFDIFQHNLQLVQDVLTRFEGDTERAFEVLIESNTSKPKQDSYSDDEMEYDYEAPQPHNLQDLCFVDENGETIALSSFAEDDDYDSQEQEDVDEYHHQPHYNRPPESHFPATTTTTSTSPHIERHQQQQHNTHHQQFGNMSGRAAAHSPSQQQHHQHHQHQQHPQGQQHQQNPQHQQNQQHPQHQQHQQQQQERAPVVLPQQANDVHTAPSNNSKPKRGKFKQKNTTADSGDNSGLGVYDCVQQWATKQLDDIGLPKDIDRDVLVSLLLTSPLSETKALATAHLGSGLSIVKFVQALNRKRKDTNLL